MARKRLYHVFDNATAVNRTSTTDLTFKMQLLSGIQRSAHYPMQTSSITLIVNNHCGSAIYTILQSIIIRNRKASTSYTYTHPNLAFASRNGYDHDAALNEDAVISRCRHLSIQKIQVINAKRGNENRNHTNPNCNASYHAFCSRGIRLQVIHMSNHSSHARFYVRCKATGASSKYRRHLGPRVLPTQRFPCRRGHWPKSSYCSPEGG